jgi:hypothetical protein
MSIVSIDKIEAMTGFDFFPDLHGTKFEQLESVQGQSWD